MKLGLPKSSYTSDLLENSSTNAFKRLLDAIDGKLFFKSFSEASLDLTTFDWEAGSSNRNWWWQLQQLPFVRWYIQSVALTKEYPSSDCVTIFVVDAFIQWRKKKEFLGNKSPLVWHDHATALRLKNIVDFYVALKGMDCLTEKVENALSEEIVLHVDWLINEKNYSKNTNHGFDQADVLYKVFLILKDFSEINYSGDISRKRLVNEISYAFTEQGVHKENSPGYHHFMMARLFSLSEYKSLGDPELSVMGDEYYQRSKAFLSAITMPDGTLPIIGDTKGDEKVRVQERERDEDKNVPIYVSGCKVWNFSTSGYVIVEYIDKVTGLLSKLVVKSGQHSQYHRHDDDLSIYWQIGSQIILGDGGVYSYNEKDPKRKFVRSGMAHNCIYIPGKSAIRKMSELKRPAELSVISDPNRIVGVTFSYQNWKLRRVINIEKIQEGELIVDDKAHSDNQESTVATNWFLPFDVSLAKLPKDGISDFDIGQGLRLTITSHTSVEGMALFSGWSGDERTSAISSFHFGKVTSAIRQTSYWNGPGRHKVSLKVQSD